MPFHIWIQTALSAFGIVLIPLVAWAFRLQLKNAALEARVLLLERWRDDDRTEIRNISNTQTAILITLERIETRMAADRKGGA